MDKKKLRLLPRRRLPIRLMEVSWRDLVVVLLPIALVITAVVWVAVTFVRPAPPNTIRMLGGAEGSSYRTHAERYKKIIEGFGVKVEILPSKGSLDNLQRLAGHPGGRRPRDDARRRLRAGRPDRRGGHQGAGVAGQRVRPAADGLLPRHRTGGTPDAAEGQAAGHRARGQRHPGAGAEAAEGQRDRRRRRRCCCPSAARRRPTALAAGTIDAAFLMGDSASPKVMRRLRDTPGVEMMNLRQAAGYVRKFRFLTRLTLPEGAIDLGKNNPPRTVRAGRADGRAGGARGSAPGPVRSADLRRPRGARRAGHVPRRRRIPQAAAARLSRSARTPSATTSRAGSSCTSGCRSGWPAWSIGCWC